jgi:hypothetical protein
VGEKHSEFAGMDTIWHFVGPSILLKRQRPGTAVQEH